jgi:hypothetical protein
VPDRSRADIPAAYGLDAEQLPAVDDDDDSEQDRQDAETEANHRSGDPAADGLVISSPAADAYQLATSIEGTNSQGEQGAS